MITWESLLIAAQIVAILWVIIWAVRRAVRSCYSRKREVPAETIEVPNFDFHDALFRLSLCNYSMLRLHPQEYNSLVAECQKSAKYLWLPESDEPSRFMAHPIEIVPDLFEINPSRTSGQVAT